MTAPLYGGGCPRATLTPGRRRAKSPSQVARSSIAPTWLGSCAVTVNLGGGRARFRSGEPTSKRAN